MCRNFREKLYTVYDETDTLHCILIGNCTTLDRAKEIAKEHKKLFPSAVIRIYEMIKDV